MTDTPESSEPRPVASAPEAPAPAGYTPAPPPPYVPATPPAYPPQPTYPYQRQAPDQPKKRNGWIIALVLIGVLLLGGCALAAALVASVGGFDTAGGFGDSIALIHIDGAISGTGSSIDGVVTPEDIIDQLDQAENDPSVKAVLLRIDSPGGTVAASQEIAMAVERMSVPVVSSIGDIGASGAYMVASQSDHIVAAPGSAVGSIGVIMQLTNLQGLLDKVGVEFTVITKGDLKDTGSPYRSITTTEVALIDEQMTVAYEQFIADVAKGRDMDVEDIQELATGWAWMGTEALELGLVDSLGNYSDGVDKAAELGGIEGEPNIVTFEPTLGFEDLAFSLFGFKSMLNPADAAALQRLGLPR
jgi:protease-4